MPRGVGLNWRLDSATIQRRLWTPEEFRPTAWFDASDLTTISVATGVSNWTNKGTLGLVASQATAANQPAFRVSDGDFNRRPYPYLDFDGTNDSLSIAGAIGGGSVQAMYLFAVARPGGAAVPYKTTVFGSVDGSIWVLRATGTTSFSQWRFVNAGTVQDTSFNNGRQNAVVNMTTAGANTGAWQTTADEWGVYSRQLITTSGTAGINFNFNPTFIARGDGSAGNTTSYTKIAECLAIPSEIGARGRQRVEGYLAWKWGLPLVAEHPFANRPPVIGS